VECVRAIEEGALLLEDLAGDLSQHGDGTRADVLAAEAMTTRQSEQVRRLVVSSQPLPVPSTRATTASSSGAVVASEDDQPSSSRSHPRSSA
jgi:hypothetical protein